MMNVAYNKILLSLGLAVLFVVGITGRDRQWTGDISGTITDKETEAPIAGVLVSSRSMKTNYAISTMSGDDGTYCIHDSRWGPNEVRAYQPNYELLVRYADVIRDKSVTLDFELELIPDSVYPTITVWVTTESDTPIGEARVDLYRIEDVSYKDYVYLETKLTDADGYTQFEISKLEEGDDEEYLLRIAAVGYKNGEEILDVSFDDPFVTAHVIMEPA